jgi:hypothetical protein
VGCPSPIVGALAALERQGRPICGCPRVLSGEGTSLTRGHRCPRSPTARMGVGGRGVSMQVHEVNQELLQYCGVAATATRKCEAKLISEDELGHLLQVHPCLFGRLLLPPRLRSTHVLSTSIRLRCSFSLSWWWNQILLSVGVGRGLRPCSRVGGDARSAATAVLRSVGRAWVPGSDQAGQDHARRCDAAGWC